MDRNTKFSSGRAMSVDSHSMHRWAQMQKVLEAPVAVEERCYSLADIYDAEPDICSCFDGDIGSCVVAAAPDAVAVAADTEAAVAALPPTDLAVPPAPPSSPAKPKLQRRKSVVDVVLAMQRKSLSSQYASLRKQPTIPETETETETAQKNT